MWVWVCVSVSYPGGHRKSRVAPTCCSTWPRTHKSWWVWRLRSPRPASPHRRPAYASCSACRRTNESQNGLLTGWILFGSLGIMFITRQTTDQHLCTLIQWPMMHNKFFSDSDLLVSSSLNKIVWGNGVGQLCVFLCFISFIIQHTLRVCDLIKQPGWPSYCPQ